MQTVRRDPRRSPPASGRIRGWRSCSESRSPKPPSHCRRRMKKPAMDVAARSVRGGERRTPHAGARARARQERRRACRAPGCARGPCRRSRAIPRSEARAMPRSCSFGTNEEHDLAQEAKALLAARHLGGRIQDRDLLQMGAGDAGTHGVAVSASGLVQTAEMSAEILTSSPTTTPPVSSACCQRSPNSPRLSVPRTSSPTRCWP